MRINIHGDEIRTEQASNSDRVKHRRVIYLDRKSRSPASIVFQSTNYAPRWI